MTLQAMEREIDKDFSPSFSVQLRQQHTFRAKFHEASLVTFPLDHVGAADVIMPTALLGVPEHPQEPNEHDQEDDHLPKDFTQENLLQRGFAVIGVHYLKAQQHLAGRLSQLVSEDRVVANE